MAGAADAVGATDAVAVSAAGVDAGGVGVLAPVPVVAETSAWQPPKEAAAASAVMDASTNVETKSLRDMQNLSVFIRTGFCQTRPPFDEPVRRNARETIS